MSQASSTRNAPVWATILLTVIGVVLVVVAVLYFTDTAAKLPSFFPGHQSGSAHHHTKHAIAATIAAIVAFAAAWLSSGHKGTA